MQSDRIRTSSSIQMRWLVRLILPWNWIQTNRCYSITVVYCRHTQEYYITTFFFCTLSEDQTLMMMIKRKATSNLQLGGIRWRRWAVIQWSILSVDSRVQLNSQSVLLRHELAAMHATAIGFIARRLRKHLHVWRMLLTVIWSNGSGVVCLHVIHYGPMDKRPVDFISLHFLFLPHSLSVVFVDPDIDKIKIVLENKRKKNIYAK